MLLVRGIIDGQCSEWMHCRVLIAIYHLRMKEMGF